jgi:hypothetical protein
MRSALSVTIEAASTEIAQGSSPGGAAAALTWAGRAREEQRITGTLVTVCQIWVILGWLEMEELYGCEAAA